MDERVILGILAILIGVGVGFVLFVPFVAISYRRRGGLGFWRFAGWAAFLVYFFAIWTYTLLPLPDPDAIACVGAILDPRSVVDDVIAGLQSGNPLRSPQLLQIAFNVLLFIPLGFFLRVLLGRGLIVTVLTGLGVSLLIEVTQLTGVWGLYPCAYRFFDVGDLMTNTTGALIGGVLSLVIPRRHWGAGRAVDAGAPRPVTKPRRVLAMLCDAIAVMISSAAAGIGTQLWLEYIAEDHAAVVDGTAAQAASTAAPLVVLAAVILTTGRSVGDLTVELRYAGGPVPEPFFRVLRYVTGIGGYLLLALLPAPWSALAFAFAAVIVITTLATERGRGLPGLLTGRRLVDARD